MTDTLTEYDKCILDELLCNLSLTISQEQEGDGDVIGGLRRVEVIYLDHDRVFTTVDEGNPIPTELRGRKEFPTKWGGEDRIGVKFELVGSHFEKGLGYKCEYEAELED
jgi:hypothetical protein